ncbi:adenylate kinase [Fragilaria crotonensis]|nr:adenylate kinase [Fragilaria crotonensis]
MNSVSLGGCKADVSRIAGGEPPTSHSHQQAAGKQRTRLLQFCRDHLAAPAASHLTGMPGGDLPPAHADADSPWLHTALPWTQATQEQRPVGKRRAEHISEAEETLGKLAMTTAQRVRKYGWEARVRNARGESNLASSVRRLPHRAARLLDHLRKRGASMVSASGPWGTTLCDTAVHRGSHKSAHLDRAFVFEEMLDFCAQGYWAVLPYSEVRHWTALRVSPFGAAVPQRDRRPRQIVDYSFSGVNDDTVRLAPREAMQFLERALQQVLARIVRADPRYGQDRHGRRILPGVAAVSDIRNKAHRLEAVTATPPSHAAAAATSRGTSNPCGRPGTPASHTQGQPPVAAVNVYVDNFLLMAQMRSLCPTVLRTALTSIDEVFRPLAVGDPPQRKKPASVKKMLKGDASWSTQKRIHGWDLDPAAGTIQLPPHRVTPRLYNVLFLLRPPRKRISTAKWHQFTGELRSMSPALPGARGLFSVLQDALGKADRNRVRITPQVWHMAQDLTAIADSFARTRSDAAGVSGLMRFLPTRHAGRRLGFPLPWRTPPRPSHGAKRFRPASKRYCAVPTNRMAHSSFPIWI